jgi:hypothetical protein
VLTTLAQRLAITETELLLEAPTSKAAPGTSIVLGGLGFDVTRADNHAVLFAGNKPGVVRAVTRDSITVDVPEGASSGEVAVSLTAVDPKVSPAKIMLTVLRTFRIASVIPARSAGAYAGEPLRVVLDAPLEETTNESLFLSLDGEVLPDPTLLDATSLSVLLPEALLPSEEQPHELCVHGTLTTACAPVSVLGAGHSNLSRSPQCRSFDLSLDAHNFRWPFPMSTVNSSGLFSLPSRAFVLDENLDLLFGIDTSSGETIETYPMLPDAFHDALIVHSGCTTLVCGARPGPGYAAAVDRTAQVLYFTRFDNGDRFAFDLGDFSAEPFVIDRARFGVFLTPTTGATEVIIIDVTSPPTTLTDTVSLGGRLNSHAAVDPPAAPSSATEMRLRLAVVNEGINTRFVFIDLAGSVPVVGKNNGAAPPGDLAPSTLQRGNNTLHWVPGTNIAAMTLVAECNTQSQLFRFDVSTKTLLSRRFIDRDAFGGAGGATCPVVGESPLAVSELDGSKQWVVTWWQQPFTTHRAVYAATVPTLDALMTTPPATSASLRLPIPSPGYTCVSAPDLTCANGRAFIDTPPTSLSIASRNQESPKDRSAFAVFDTGVVTYALDTDASTAATAGSAFGLSLVPPALLIVQTTLFVPTKTGELVQISASGAVASVTKFKPPRPEILRAASGELWVNVGRSFNNTTTAGATYFGAPAVESFYAATVGTPAKGTTAQDVTAIVDAGDLVAITRTEFGDTSDVETWPLAPASLCDAPLRLMSLPSMPVPAPAVLSPVNVKGETLVYGSCYATPLSTACPQLDPTDASYVHPDHVPPAACPNFDLCPKAGSAVAMFDCQRPAAIELWKQNAGVYERFDTGLCGEQAGALNAFSTGTDEQVLVWSIMHPTPGSGGLICQNGNPISDSGRQVIMMSKLKFGTSVENLTTTLTGETAIRLVGANERLVSSFVASERSEIWFARVADGTTQTEIVVAHGDTLAVEEIASVGDILQALELSPDGRRLYALGKARSDVYVYLIERDENGAPQLLLLGSQQLPASGSRLLSSDDGATLLADIEGGYCSLSD